MTRTRWRGSWQPFVGLLAGGVAVLPKCPVCLMTAAGAVGLGSIPAAIWLPRVFPVALAAAVAPLLVNAVRHHSYVGLVTALTGSGVLIAVWNEAAGTIWSAPAALALSAGHAVERAARELHGVEMLAEGDRA